MKIGAFERNLHVLQAIALSIFLSLLVPHQAQSALSCEDAIYSISQIDQARVADKIIKTVKSVTAVRKNTAQDDTEALRQAARIFLPGVPEEQAIEELRAKEHQALEAIFRLLPKSYVKTTEPLKAWLATYKAHLESGQMPTVMWNNALSFGLRSGLFAAVDLEPEYMNQARSLLRIGRERLTRTNISEDASDAELTAPLPRDVLGKYATRKEIIFHNAIYGKGDLKFFGRISQQLKNFIPLKRDYVASLIFMSALFSQTYASSGLSGLMYGLTYSCFIEFYAHKTAGHSTEKTIKAIKEVSPTIGNFIEKWTIAHGRIHHSEFSKNFVEKYGDFDPTDPAYEEKVARNKEKGARLKEAMIAKSPDIARTVELSKDGSTFGRPFVNALTILPATVGLLAATNIVAPFFGLHPDAVFNFTAFASSFTFIGAINWYHDRMHVPKEQMFEAQNPIEEFVMSTRLGRAGNRKHAVHHFHGNKEETITANPIDVLMNTSKPITFEELLLLYWQKALI